MRGCLCGFAVAARGLASPVPIYMGKLAVARGNSNAIEGRVEQDPHDGVQRASPPTHGSINDDGQPLEDRRSVLRSPAIRGIDASVLRRPTVVAEEGEHGGVAPAARRRGGGLGGDTS